MASFRKGSYSHGRDKELRCAELTNSEALPAILNLNNWTRLHDVKST